MFNWLLPIEFFLVFDWGFFLLSAIFLCIAWGTLEDTITQKVKIWPGFLMMTTLAILWHRTGFTVTHHWFDIGIFTLIYFLCGTLYSFIRWREVNTRFFNGIKKVDAVSETTARGVLKDQYDYRAGDVTFNKHADGSISLDHSYWPVGQWVAYWPLYTTRRLFSLPKWIGEQIVEGMSGIYRKISFSKRVTLSPQK